MTTLVSHITVVDRIQVYQGTFFGRVVVKIGTEESFYEQSANLRFTRNADLSNAGAEWYDGSGTVHLRARPFTCSEGAASGAVLEANLQLFNEGPLAGTYQLSVGSMLPINSLHLRRPAQADRHEPGGRHQRRWHRRLPAHRDRRRPRPARRLLVVRPDRASNATGRANWTLRAVE